MQANVTDYLKDFCDLFFNINNVYVFPNKKNFYYLCLIMT